MTAKFKPLEGYPELPPGEALRRSLAIYEEAKLRRTVRDFSDRPVDLEIIKNCIRTAGAAPSGANQQPWHFVIITNPEIRKRIRAAAEKEEREFYQHRAPQEWLRALEPFATDANKPFLEIAPCLICIFTKKHGVDDEGRIRKHYYVQESVGIATGMLISALHRCGLATLTHTPSPMGFLNEILSRPSSEAPFLLLVTGFPAAGAKVPVLSKKGLDEIASFV